MLDLGITWLPIIGAVIVSLGITAYFTVDASKSLAIWSCFVGTVMIAGGFCLHLQKIAWESEAPTGTKAKPSEKEIVELRAYVLPTEAVMNEFIFEPNHKFMAKISFRNSGRTPAYDFSGTFDIVLAAFPLVTELKASETPYSGITFAPGAAFDMRRSGRPIPKELWDLLVEGTVAFYIFGEYSYRDAFGIRRTGKFRYYFGGKDGLRTDRRLTLHPQGNKTD